MKKTQRCSSQVCLSDEDHYLVYHCSKDKGHEGGHKAIGTACSYQAESQVSVNQEWAIEWTSESVEKTKARWLEETKALSVPANAAQHLSDIFNAQDEYGFGLDGEEEDGHRITPAELLTNNESFEKLADWCRNNCFEDLDVEEEKHYGDMVKAAMDTLEGYYRGQRL